MNIKELAEKYELTNDDFWKHKQSGKWILTHDACTIISHKEEIKLESFDSLYQSDNECRFLIGMSKDGRIVKSVGEAGKSNCTSKYLGCMAEKRGRDRCVLKLINAYEYGIYSEEESDDFKSQGYKPSKSNDDKPTDYQKNYVRKLLSENDLYDKTLVESGFQVITKNELSQYISSFKQDDKKAVLGNLELLVDKFKNILKIKES